MAPIYAKASYRCFFQKLRQKGASDRGGATTRSQLLRRKPFCSVLKGRKLCHHGSPVGGGPKFFLIKGVDEKAWGTVK